MSNVYNLKDFRKVSKGQPITENSVKESVVIKQGNSYLVQTEVVIDQSLINSYVKKVRDENGQNIKETWSDQQIADKIASFVVGSFTNIENLTSAIVLGDTTQAPVQTQVQPQAQTPVQEVPAEGTQPENLGGQAQTPPAQTPPAQGQAQVPPAQGQAAQTAAQVPAQTAPPAQASQEI